MIAVLLLRFTAAWAAGSVPDSLGDTPDLYKIYAVYQEANQTSRSIEVDLKNWPIIPARLKKDGVDEVLNKLTLVSCARSSWLGLVFDKIYISIFGMDGIAKEPKKIELNKNRFHADIPDTPPIKIKYDFTEVRIETQAIFSQIFLCAAENAYRKEEGPDRKYRNDPILNNQEYVPGSKSALATSIPPKRAIFQTYEDKHREIEIIYSFCDPWIDLNKAAENEDFFLGRRPGTQLVRPWRLIDIHKRALIDKLKECGSLKPYADKIKMFDHGTDGTMTYFKQAIEKILVNTSTLFTFENRNGPKKIILGQSNASENKVDKKSKIVVTMRDCRSAVSIKYSKEFEFIVYKLDKDKKRDGPSTIGKITCDREFPVDLDQYSGKDVRAAITYRLPDKTEFILSSVDFHVNG